MAGTLKKVRFKLAWQAYKVGDEITPSGVLRDFLVAHGFATVVQEAELNDRPARMSRRAAAKIAATTAGANDVVEAS
jgi:hypothetical protein